MTDTQEDVRLHSQQIAPKTTPLAHRTASPHDSDVTALVERYRDAISFKGVEEAFAVVVELAAIAKDAEAWRQKRSIVSGPIRYEVLGAENVNNHETVHDFIEVLSPPSIEATKAISAHTDLMEQLSDVLATLAAYQNLGSSEYLAALVEAVSVWRAAKLAMERNRRCRPVSKRVYYAGQLLDAESKLLELLFVHDNVERLREEGL